ncbi:recombinase family protein [Erythrobacter sp. NFXS35]|uniref:recombinase family protein n=1 Tax=Erythrobacter sp. NFXS35 TaxID=2818436 RepID=UPI0032DF0956
MTDTLIGYARCSTDKQDLTAQRRALIELGVPEDRIYTDHGLTGRNRDRPGLAQALAAVRAGETLVVPKLDRLARSVPDARAIADDLEKRGVSLALGKQVYGLVTVLCRSPISLCHLGFECERADAAQI